MLVKNWMTKEVITIDADASMQDASIILTQNNFRILPVLKKGNLAQCLFPLFRCRPGCARNYDQGL